jgi:hypothetical protein
MWVKWNLSSFYLEMVLVSVQDSALFVSNVPSAHKSFWTHPMVLRGDKAQVKLGLFVGSANLDTR